MSYLAFTGSKINQILLAAADQATDSVLLKTPFKVTLRLRGFDPRFENINKLVRTSDSHIRRQIEMSRVIRIPVFGVSDQVLHKPGCTDTEDGSRLTISDLGRREIVLFM